MAMEQFHYERRTGCETEFIELLLDGDRGRIEITYIGMGLPGGVYRLSCIHTPLSAAFGMLEVDRVEARTGAGEFAEVELEEEQFPLPLVVEYLRVPLSPVFVHEGTSLAGAGFQTPEFTLMLAVYDLEGRPESGRLLEIYDHLDKKKLAPLETSPVASTVQAVD